MDYQYLRIPLDLDQIMLKGHIQRIDDKQSIHEMIHLITTTSFGEVKHEPTFGCDIWKYDFENIYNPHWFKEELRQSILTSLHNNEKRLEQVNVDLAIEQVEIPTMINNRRVKTRINLVVEAIIAKTNERFMHQETFFIGPLSYS